MNKKLKNLKSDLEPVLKKYKDQIFFCYCFGSLAAEQFSKSSDVDLAFYVDPKYLNYDFKFSLYADCSRALKRNDIDIVILNNLQNLILAESIVRDGVILYDSNREKRISYELKMIHQAIDFRFQRKLVMGI